MKKIEKIAERAYERLKTLEGVTYAEWIYIKETTDKTFNYKAKEAAEGFAVSPADIEKMKEFRLFRHCLNKDR